MSLTPPYWSHKELLKLIGDSNQKAWSPDAKMWLWTVSSMIASKIDAKFWMMADPIKDHYSLYVSYNNRFVTVDYEWGLSGVRGGYGHYYPLTLTDVVYELLEVYS